MLQKYNNFINTLDYEKISIGQKIFRRLSDYIKKSVFLPPIFKAEVAQLVEHNLAKVGVASSSLVFRSIVETMCTSSLRVFKTKQKRHHIVTSLLF